MKSFFMSLKSLWLLGQKICKMLNQEQLKQDIDKQLTLEQVEIDKELYEKHNVSQTPTININGITMEDPFDYEAIKEVIDREIEASKNE
ncbi:DsbA family protein [Ureibacillus thermosphaericus]|uniref:DsbA family protein n=1 Tax=Ureibacillus thermosphaericus TaxID=51173 RepID=UPI0030CA06CC